MLKSKFWAASSAAIMTIGFVGSTMVTSTPAAAQRGFGCQINPSRCDNQLRTPRTFASDRKKGNQAGPGRKKNKKK